MNQLDNLMAVMYLKLLAESYMNDLRLEGKYEFADQIRNVLRLTGFNLPNLSVKDLKEYRDGYRIHRNMPDATITELELFDN